MGGDDAASVSEARVSTSSIISAHQSLSPPLLTWFACVYPIANVKNQPPKGADIIPTIFQCLMLCAAVINVLEVILDELRKRCSC